MHGENLTLYNSIIWCFGITILVKETKQFSSFVLLVTYKGVSTIYKPLCVATETQQWVLFVLLWSNRVFRTAVNSTNLFGSSCQVPDTVVRF